MPELPEVETVRAGLQRWVVGRTIASVQVRHERSVRRHLAGAQDLIARLTGTRIESAQRRGKYLWLPLASADRDLDEALIVHLGMSGQLLVQPSSAPDEKHLHVRIGFTDDERELRFVDQRTFGGLQLDELIPTLDGVAGLVPRQVAHIARDLIDPAFDDQAFVVRLRRRHSAIKRCLLDQTLLSGVGNIYADEALWRARLNGERVAATLTRTQVTTLLAEARSVLGQALAAGGTSFDALYVNVNGQSGYFDRSLNAYGREGEPCPRCGAAIRRSAFMNRSSFYCPKCQRSPRV
ncbi:MAG: bifunctional DNA-formamidopyrimidine glycosylase/DNA-(apurinic or apyrimidinic site) lyase [Jatrophihabitantaceae bacterium]